MKPSMASQFLPVASIWHQARAICALCARATASRSRSLGLVLPGMGNDGTRGAADIIAAGGNLIAQDEATSVVWGMPRSAAHAGLCSAVLPLNEIAPKILGLFSGGRS